MSAEGYIVVGIIAYLCVQVGIPLMSRALAERKRQRILTEEQARKTALAEEAAAKAKAKKKSSVKFPSAAEAWEEIEDEPGSWYNPATGEIFEPGTKEKAA